MVLTYNKLRTVVAILAITLLILMSAWYVLIIPKNTDLVLSEKIKKVMSGQMPSIEIYRDANLLKEMIVCLDSKAIMGTRIKVAVRRDYPNKLRKSPRYKYFTRSDWALETLSYISFSDLPVRPTSAWQIKVSNFQYRSGLSPILLKESECLVINKEIIENWKSLWQEYFDYMSLKRKSI